MDRSATTQVVVPRASLSLSLHPAVAPLLWREGLVVGAFVLFPWAAATLTSYIRSPSVKNWKRNLQKPPKPPLWWLLRKAKPLVYCTAGAASFLVWRQAPDTSGWSPKSTALVLLGCGLLLDLLWSPLLFYGKLVGTAGVDRALASVALGAALPVVARVNPVAGALLLPMFGWECCGAYWCYVLWRLNRHELRQKRRNRDTHGYTTLGEE